MNLKKTFYRKMLATDIEHSQEETDNIIQPFQLYTHTYQTTEYWFYLSTIIGEPSLYTDMVHTIRAASQHDIIYLCLNTPGGRLDTGIQIINAMKASKATVISVLEAEAASMGAIIFLAADQHIVNDNCRMMFHDFSGGATSGAKGNEQFKELTASIQLYNKLLKNVCVPFLSNEEVDRIIKGEDVWMDSDQIRKRLKIMEKVSDEKTKIQSVKKKTTSEKKNKQTNHENHQNKNLNNENKEVDVPVIDNENDESWKITREFCS